MGRRGDTDWVRRYWDKSAASYDRSMAFVEKILLGDGRRWLGGQARGDVLEIGVGTGRNLAYYPPDIRLTCIDLSAGMLKRAQLEAMRLGRHVDLRLGDAQKLEFAAELFDTVVFSLSLCSIPDDRAAIREAKRVLRAGGRLVALEHVGSRQQPVRVVQRFLDLFTSHFQGDHMLREPAGLLRAEGFAISEDERSKLGIIERIVAIKPT
jgi:Methylase involved in ubiquinone/menaquinone biosynthesis